LKTIIPRVLFVVAQINNNFGMNTFIYSQGEALKNNGVNIEYFILKGRSWLKYIIGIFTLRKYLKKNYFDIVHAHYSYCGLVAAINKKNPLVVSLMGSDLFEVPDQSLTINKVINKFLLIKVLQKADAVICKSVQMKEYLNNGFKNVKNLIVIPNGINTEKFKPSDKYEARKSLGLDFHKKYILFASQTNMLRKNFNLAKSSFDILNKTYQNGQLELLSIYGIEQDLLIKYLNACDVLLFTSLVEGSPNLIKEAMACNCPVVSVNVGDVAERLNGISNSYVTSYAPGDIVEKLKAVLSSGERSNGRDKIIKALDDSIISREIIKVYNKVRIPQTSLNEISAYD
jgi:teichuronic acid biosynthesis glycosyltransferase TuaC